MTAFLGAAATARFPTISLDALNDAAALLTRTDRKYVVALERIEEVLDTLVGMGAQVLDIDGRRSFSYESVYFDTPDLTSYLGAARRRRRRFKVRTRTYVDADTCRVELKLRTGKGQTEKVSCAHETGLSSELTDDALRFLAGHPALGCHATLLSPSATTRYRRTTFRLGNSRVTVDTEVSFHIAHRSSCMASHAIVESKTLGASGPLDRALWAMHQRPVGFSKYGVGLASLRPELPSNRWHRVLGRYVTQGAGNPQ